MKKSLTRSIAVAALCGSVFTATRMLARGASPGADATVMVKARQKPQGAWKTYPTRTLATLRGFTPAAQPPALDKFGGLLNRKEKASGFFHAKKIGVRWWLIDPDGGLFLNVGMVAVAPPKTAALKPAFEKRFSSTAVWSEKTTELLRGAAFNGLGAWTDVAEMRAAPHPLVYTQIWDFMSGFGRTKKLTKPGSGHVSYPDGCIPVFHPDFESYCNERAKALAPTKDDPLLLGHFSDNEMPPPRLEAYLKLDLKEYPEMASTRDAARQWLDARKEKGPNPGEVTDSDRSAWAEFVLERYHRIVTTAIRKVDPNHMCLGSRYHGQDRKSEAAFRAAGKYCDVIAYNYYADWGIEPKLLREWTAWSGRPSLISEFYVKGDDVGFNNQSGAGWIVPTQKERGLFYQHFALDALESKVCVGWHWFKYLDQGAQLADGHADADANKGILNLRFEPYQTLLDAMRPLNINVYALADHFDGASAGK